MTNTVSPTIFAVAAIAVALVACVTDIANRRIPNPLTFGAALAGVMAHIALGGWSGIGISVGGWLVGLACFFPFFLLGGMGGGDVKLLAALGAWLGPWDALWLAVYASIAGGVMAIVVSLWSGYLRAALRNIWTLLRFWWLVGPRPMPALTLERHQGPRLAYALPIFAATVVKVWEG
jgi:prepilin peptidase CpaA